MVAGISGIIPNCTGIFFEPVANSLQVGRGDISFYFTIFGLAGALCAPFAGYIIHKINIKFLLSFGILLDVIAIWLMSLYHNIWQFYLSGFLLGCGYSISSQMAVSVLINNWFHKRHGLAMGITMSCSSISAIVMNPVLNSVITTTGWRAAYRLEALVILLLALPGVLFVIRMYPSDIGLAPYGGTMDMYQPAALPKSKNAPLRKIPALSRAFLLVLTFAFLYSISMSFLNHLSGHATSVGLTSAMGATMISVAMAGAFAGKLCMGGLSDHIGVMKTFSLFIGAGIIGLLGFLAIGTAGKYLSILFALLYGLMYACLLVGMPLLVRSIFGDTQFSIYYSYIGIACSIGYAMGFPLVGYTYDALDSYVPAIIGITCCTAISLLLLQVLGRKVKKPFHGKA